MHQLNLRTKFNLIGLALIAVAFLVGLIGIYGIRQTNSGLETVYNDRVVPLQHLKVIADEYAVAVIDAVNKANAGLFSAEEALRSIDAADARIHRLWKDYLSTRLTPEEERLSREASVLFQAADKAIAQLRQHVQGLQGSIKGQMEDFDGPLYQHIDPISGKISELVDLQLRVARQEYDAAQYRFQLVLWLTGLALVLGTGASGTLGWFITHNLTRTIQHATQRLADGADHSTAAVQEVSASSNALAEGANEQAASLEEVSASLEEIGSMTERNAEYALNGSRLGQKARAAADGGLERLSELDRTLAGMTAAVDEMHTAVADIESSGRDVTSIIKTINEIAFQTNLLALNAAVEAARAGDAGRGFAVVANEVRALAQRSAQAAQDTASRIESSTRSTALGSAASKRLVLSLGEVESTARSIQQVFDGIVEDVKTLDGLASEIAAASKEQNQGLAEVNRAMGQIGNVTQANAAAAEENASAAHELEAQTSAQRLVVEQLERAILGSKAVRRLSASPSAPRTAASAASFALPAAPAGTSAPSFRRNGSTNGHYLNGSAQGHLRLAGRPPLNGTSPHR